MEKDQVLVSYQNATGQRDRQSAVRALEQHNWNLEAALRTASAAPPARVTLPRDRTISLWRFLMSLLPQGAKDEWNPRTAVRLFSLEFEERWGARHPTFFEGSYREALSKAKQEYKFLLVYLHSASHPNTGPFCRDVMCSEPVVAFLNQNFVLWAISVSYPPGYEMSTTLGATSFPFITLLDGYNMANGQHVVTEGGTLVGEKLIESLVLLMEEQGASLVAARAHNDEMVRNRQMVAEQNSEYMRSLEADQAKERHLADEQRKQEEEETRSRLEEERRRHDEEQILLKRKQDLERKQIELPPAPPAEAKEVSSVVIRLPNGNRLVRRFNTSDLVLHVYHFVDLNSELRAGSYHLVSPYPKRVHSNMDMTLADAGLVPQAALLIQEL